MTPFFPALETLEEAKAEQKPTSETSPVELLSQDLAQAKERIGVLEHQITSMQAEMKKVINGYHQEVKTGSRSLVLNLSLLQEI